jgi:hypothetical protein
MRLKMFHKELLIPNIEESIIKFSNVIPKAAWSATPDDKPQAKYLEYPWEIKSQFKKKRKLRRRLQMRRHSEDEHTRRYNEATRKLKDHIKRITEESFQTCI